ncbi:potassium-transporting ATPase subunit KdpC [Phenylobacterium aquaticum]|uniref:potassium-transporting ATPase subunit KdpC n=1 Tax=Phenylobacterium aquaticum TaxID=1763816 RepID=UPI0026F083FB|nr:potassium-transporting ATPase subunit KdpC [Phenylobacterium aquaticum]
MLASLRPAIVTTVFFTLLLGVAYPLAVTGVSQLLFPWQAGGSLIRSGGQVIGSELIGQTFARAEYLHSRPSAAGTNGYDASASSGSNLGPLNPDLIKREGDSAKAVGADRPGTPVPADALTTSASGLDPHITPDYAAFQVARVAQARGVKASEVEAVIAANTEGRTLGVLGQPHVNVLKVNLALDARYPVRHAPAA